MNRRVVSIGAACVGALSMLAAAPAAYGDESMFLQQAQAEEVITEMGASTAQLLRLGAVVCEVMRTQINNGSLISQARAQADKAVGRTAYSMGLQPTRAGVMLLTEEAENNLC